MKLCPINRMGEECISKDSNGKASIDELQCTGCGICSNRCPFKAISIINLPTELQKDPIHRYGMNGFHLYNLPLPVFGKVVGVVGRNGIGKTTAIQILAGLLKPNFGAENHDENQSFDELIDKFKGTEAQVFFEKLKHKEVTISYKLQKVELLAKRYSCTVKELLLKADETNSFARISKLLNIKGIMDRKISELSGGELQKIAIAGCFLKKANVFILDEPTSFLDIKQRIAIAKFLRSQLSADISILVVEHDLVVLDYMADIIHILYGVPGVYGVVSLPKTVRDGINVYLLGFLKEENIRFRDHELRFYSRPPLMLKKEESIISWQSLSKKLGEFTMKASDGQIPKKGMIGVLGENGIGKTTLMKVLAGEIKPDSGKISKEVKISYKPQYIEIKEDEIVRIFLKSAISQFSNQLIKPFELDLLLDRKLSELSGGELQRVMIAKALSTDADIYLLDEPSAYLDVEQRLIVAKTISTLIDIKERSAIIVDHDLLFIDNVSSLLFVFKGKPSISGECIGPIEMEEGMNSFLKELEITFRRDIDSKRPRANKEGSQLDVKQKHEGKYYYG
jgi:ATP-binding cassette subfamily E protein 1